jgi:hypothetical protein
MKRFLLGLAAAMLFAAPANAGGIITNGLPTTPSPLTGAEALAADTNLSGGRAPQSVQVTPSQLKGYFQTPFSLTTPTAYGTVAIDATQSSLFKLDLDVTGAVLETPSNLQAGQVFRIAITHTADGTKTLNYPGIYKWVGGTEPTLSTTDDKVDMLTFVCATTTACYGTSSIGY